MGHIKDIVDKAIEDGVLTQAEHEEIMDAIHADGEIDDVEREQLSRIFKLTQEGKIQVVDADRDASYERKKEEVRKKLLDQQS